MLGFFDEYVVVEGWFAPEIQPLGWFEPILLNTSSGGSYQFGYTTIGATPFGLGPDSNLGSRFTASQSGTISKIWAYGGLGVAGSGATMRVAIFANTGSNTIGALIAESASSISVTSTTPQWWGCDISASITASTDYWIFAWVDTSAIGSGYFNAYADGNAIANSIVVTFGNTYPDWSTVGDGTNENYDLGYMSIYADVTTSSGYDLVMSNGSFTASGQTANLTVNRLITADQQTYTLSGQSVNFVYAKTLTLSQATFNLSGQNANLRASRVLSLSVSTFTLSGQNNTLIVAYRVILTHSTFTLSGQSLNFLRNYNVITDNGSFSLSGQSVGLTKQSQLTIGQGVFSLSGQSTNLTTNYKLTANSGSFALSGQNATLVYNQLGAYTLVAHEGLFTLSGQVVNLNYTPANQYSLSCVYGQFTLSGQALGIYKRNHIDMNQAVFSLNTQSANLTKLSRLTISQGSFTLTGQDVTLTANKFKRRYIITS